jgi:predicted MFS family arabinose efflux permease
MQRPFRTLAREPGYLRFVAAATASRVADEMFSVGVVLLALERTGSATLAGALVAAITLPSLFTAPLLGAWLDLRGRRRALMMFDQLVASVGLVAIALLTGRAPDVLVLLIALVAGLMWPLSFGGFTSLIPAIVPDELLPPANAIEATSLNVGLIAGPVIAAAVAATAGPEAAVLTEAALTAGTLFLLAGFDQLDSGPVRQAGSLLEVVGQGLRQLVAIPQLFGTTVAGAISLMGVGTLTVAFPLFCVDHLGTREEASGVLWAAFALGSTVGALGLVRFQRGRPPHLIVVAAYTAFGLLLLPLPLAASVPVACVLVALAALADGPALAATFAVRQDWVPRDLQGQIFTTAAGVKIGMFALGSAVGGLLVTEVGSAGTLLVCAGAQFVAAAAGFAVMRGRRDRSAIATPGAT